MMEASHFDANVAFAAIDRHRLDDLKPYIYVTRDSGKSWQQITSGIPEGSYVNVIREDPVRRGLLYAGTETGMFVSFNDGAEWQPLKLNMPTVPVRDIKVHDADLVIATHGRSFWILDDVTPLRQASAEVANSAAYLFKPETAWRVRPGSDEGTPLPAEVAAGENPPDGAILDYYLKATPQGPVTLEIFDGNGKLVRRYSSAEKFPPINPKLLDIPASWVHPPEGLSAMPGMHRFVWDLHYPSAGGGRGRGGMAAMAAMFGFGGGPWVVPGEYTVKLQVEGETAEQPLTVKMDPRIKVSQEDLQKQLDLAEQVLAKTAEVSAASRQAEHVAQSLEALTPKAASRQELAQKIDAMQKETAKILGEQAANPLAASTGPAVTDRTTLRYVASALGQLERVIESDDAAPSADASTAFTQDSQIADAAVQKWQEIISTELPALNEELRRAHLEPVEATEPPAERPRR